MRVSTGTSADSGPSCGWFVDRYAVKMVGDGLDQGIDGRPSRIHDEIRHLCVQGVSHGEQFLDHLHWISHLKQWALFVVPQPPKKVLRRGSKIHAAKLGFEAITVDLGQNRPATGGNHAIAFGTQFCNDGCFDLAKSTFTVLFEKSPNGTAQALFNELIGIDKTHTGRSRQVFADCGLPCAGKTDQCDRTGLRIVHLMCLFARINPRD